ncbi:hypothetical protein [Campylobacter hyointestinalis]|uniref:FdhC protein n=1 Tax=Campylobacter hyointestinalis subsp. hyointestinalis TaxID=91352 RepID=A0A855NCM6_CAMHY|nr:hypothetical protein [Campylobacter hyointestinalis]ANE33016.1 hypothetical protein CHH_1406 [Campylobacter hyointestinalis subsp. hyointestinalis LMG 9260]KEA43818.1 hypothetical protein CR67_08330 [Campylobacter hyointestinalis subsp. hyointestinalis]MBT0612048.1 fatty-acid--CoA ligase [Campylobacter hyointestinalis subsp. hyointestinalis]MDY2998443.1 fatty-acid--CoA ligase [Campylobacter hyointestinalis]PPB57386.1 hypothetical protein CDQ70_07285 [Campylobacter hyointestinalis subsp. hyo
MNDKLVLGVIILIIIALMIIVALVVNIVLKNKRSKPNFVPNTDSNQKDRNLTIDDLISIVSDPNSSKEAIFKAVQYFISNFKFPQKEDGVAPAAARIYLRFIMLVSRHKNSDAKIISYLDNEIKKSNPNYGLEVDKSEENGMNGRSFR